MEYNVNQNPVFKTSSLQLAAYLYSCGNISFTGATSSGDQVSFGFMPYESAQDQTENYYGGRAESNPLELFQKYQTLKEMLFEVKRNPA